METKNTSIAMWIGNTLQNIHSISNYGIYGPIRITAQPHAQYVLSGESSITPDTIQTQQIDADLAITIGQSDAPQVLIENFFSAQGQLVTLSDQDEANIQPSNYSIIIDQSANAPKPFENKETAQADHVQTSAVEAKSIDSVSANTVSSHTATNKAESPSTLSIKKPVIESIEDDVGNTQGAIAPGQVTDDTSPTLSGTASFGQTVEIYANGGLIGIVHIRKPNGIWSFSPPTPLPDGEYNFTIKVLDADGTASELSDPYSIIIDTTPPEQPVIKTIYDDTEGHIGFMPSGSAINDSQPLIQGRGEAGTTVIIFDNGEEIARVKVPSDGSWSFTPPLPLEDGAHSLTVVGVDAADNETPHSPPYTFTLDTEAPNQPQITSVLDEKGLQTGEILSGGATDDDRPTFSGKAEPGSSIAIWVNGELWDNTITDADGNWTYTPVLPFTDGEYTVNVYATDKVGNTSPVSDSFNFTVDTTVGTVTITGARDDEGSVQGRINEGGVTDDTQPTLSGRATPGCLVKIYDGGILIGETVASAAGSWSFTPATALDEGAHSFTATVTTRGGGESAPTAPFTFSVDITPPEKPSIETLFDDAGQVVGQVEHNGITDDAQPELRGTAEPYSTIHILEGGFPLYTTTADENGNWNFTFPEPLSDGTYDLSVQATDPAGNTSGESDVFTVTVDTSAPTVSILNIMDDVGTAVGQLSSGSVTDDTTPTLNGQATPNAVIKIYNDGALIGETTAGSNGLWSFTPSQELPEGTYNFTATATTPVHGETVHTPAFNLTIDTTPPALPEDGHVIESVYDDVEPFTGVVESGGVTNDTRPTLSGTAEPNSTIHVYDNEQLIGSVKADADGKWSFTPETELEDGQHSLTVTIEDQAGNVSDMSEPYVIEVDTVAPVLPEGMNAIDEILDKTGSVQGPISNGGITDELQPTFNGSGEPGNTIIIRDNGTTLGEAVVGEDGKWTFTPSEEMDEGLHNIQIVIRDPAGNSSDPVGDNYFTIDTSFTAQPTITSVYDDQGESIGYLTDGALTDDARPTVSGTAEAGSTIKLYSGDILLGTTTADANGQWTMELDTDLPDGLNELTATASSNGNESLKSEVFTINVDTAAPDAATEITLSDNVGQIQENIHSGTVTDDNTPTLAGKAEPGATVIIYDNDEEIGRTSVDEQGLWSFTPDAELTDGQHSLSTQVMDEAGNKGDMSPSIDFTVDTNVPEASITTIHDDVGNKQGDLSNGAATDDTRPTLLGQATANGLVSIYNNGELIGQVKAEANGSWAFTPTDELADGEYVFTVTVTTDAHGESAPSDAFVINVDTMAPTLPEGQKPIEEAIDNSGDKTGPIENGGVTDENQPVLSGSAEPNDTITIIDNGNEIGKVQTDENGNWSFIPEPPLEDGHHDIDIIITDEAGNESETLDGIEIIVDTTESVPPVITTVIDDQGNWTGALEKGSATDDTRPTVEGTAQAGSTVYLYSGTTLLGSTVADAQGHWSITPSADLEDGEHVLTAKAENAAGNYSQSSEAFPVTVDTLAPSTVTDVTVTDGVGTIQEALKPGASTDDNQPTVSGKAESGSTVIIYDNGNEIGRVPVDENGNWTFTPDTPLTDGDHKLSAEVIDDAGNTSGIVEIIDFNVDTSIPEVSITEVLDDHGTITGLLVNGGVTDDDTPTLSGLATAGAIVTLYDDGEKLGTVTADADGKWSFTPLQPLEEGLHNLTATVTTEAHGESTPTDAFVIEVDTTAPTLPEGANAIDEILDNTGDKTGPIQNGDETDETRPVFNGSGEPGNTISLVDNGNVIGKAVVDANGKWTFTPDQPLDDGQHVIQIIITDEAGNSSDPIGDYNFTVVSVAPSVPTIDLVLDDVGLHAQLQSGDTTDDAKPTLSGMADAGTIVVIFDKGVELGRVQASGDGTWSFEPALPLLNGEHNLSVISINSAGTASEPSEGFIINVMVGGIPSSPAITTVVDDQGIYTGALQKGDATDDSRPTIEGTALAGYTVSIYDNGTLLGTTISDANGFWSFTPSEDLLDGTHALTATSRNGEGLESVATGAFTIYVDTQAPQQPTIDRVYDDQNVTGDVPQNGITDDNRPTLYGTSEAYDLITIKDGGVTLGMAFADANGKWSFTPKVPLAEGLHTLTVTAEDEAGNLSEVSDAYTFTVDTLTPQAALLQAFEVEAALVSGIEEPALNLSAADVLTDTDTALFTEATESDSNTAVQLDLSPVVNETGGFTGETLLDGLVVESYSLSLQIEEEPLA